jgi:hypothetical protein
MPTKLAHSPATIARQALTSPPECLSRLARGIDHVYACRRIFRYSAAGPEILLEGKKVVIVAGLAASAAGKARRGT